ncbi:MAG TPA: DUF222 domain-containing protein [Acidimicrobiia bacterium]|nr:DUF222 domain-containing protein [Acidimicrobiia bacterium]
MAAEQTLDQIETALEQTHALSCVLSAQFLSLLGELSEREAWAGDGARSLGEWVAARFAMSPYAAREQARVAQALRSLPSIAGAHADGRLSFDQVRALTRYATPETDTDLAREAEGLSLRTLEFRARRTRKTSKAAARDLEDSRWLTMFWRGDRLVVRGEFVGAEAKAIELALLRALEGQPRPADGEEPPPYEARLADAFHQIASGALAADPDPDRATVVVHVEAQALADDEGLAEIDGLMVSSEVARRLSCDARVHDVLEFGGIPIGIGHVSRVVPPSLRRELVRRDQGCRFPGCERRRWVHAHHIWHWGKKGPTDLGNLVLLCSYHHRFVHEGEWAIRGNPMGELEFVRPDGRVFGGGPPPLDPELKRWASGEAA